MINALLWGLFVGLPLGWFFSGLVKNVDDSTGSKFGYLAVMTTLVAADLLAILIGWGALGWYLLS